MEFSNPANHYHLRVPSDWDRKQKAGADVLFEDPADRSTSVGITVNPVRVSSIDAFGDLSLVGNRLLEAENKKESTLSTSMLQQAVRKGEGGATLYFYEYDLDSTRGRRRIMNTVTIVNSQLYIVNATLKCKDSSDDSTLRTIGTLRQISDSFDVM